MISVCIAGKPEAIAPEIGVSKGVEPPGMTALFVFNSMPLGDDGLQGYLRSLNRRLWQPMSISSKAKCKAASSSADLLATGVPESFSS